MAATGGYIVFFNALTNASPKVTVFDREGALVRIDLPVAGPAGIIGGFSAAGSDGVFLLGWIDDRDGFVRAKRLLAADVAAGRVDASATPYASSSSLTSSALRLALDGTAGIAVWLEWSYTNNGPVAQVRAQPIAESGFPVAAPLNVGSTSIGWSPAVSIAGDGYDLAFTDHAQALGGSWDVTFVTAHLSRDGTLQSIRRVPIGLDNALPHRADLARNGALTLALWLDSDVAGGHSEVLAASLADCCLTGKVTVSTAVPEQHVRRLLSLGSGVVAGLWVEQSPNERVVVGRFSADGKPLDGSGLHLRESADEQHGSAMATDGRELFIVWSEGGAVYGATVSLDGPLSANVRRLESDGGGSLDVLWNGSAFVVAWQQPSSNAIVAIRVDRSGNVLDPLPIRLTAGSPNAVFAADVDPRLAWNGTGYLLVWHYSYLSIDGIPEDDVRATSVKVQRYSQSLTADGGEISLDGSDDHYRFNSIAWDVSFSGGVWLITWGKAWYAPFWAVTTVEGYSPDAVYTRIDASGRLLDPIGGTALPKSCGGFLLSPLASGWESLSMGGAFYSSPSLGRIGLDGAASSFGALPGDVATVESIAMAPLPLVAYKRGIDDPLAYIAVVPAHRHAAGR
jgi:hypothetical protein